MVKVKICGITNEEEIDCLNELQPDYAGFVFAESRRKIDIEKAEKLCSMLSRNIKSVGVFRNQGISEIIEILNKINLDAIQLHGNEDIEFIKNLKNGIDEKIEIWKAVSIYEIENINRLVNQVYEYKDSTNEIRKEILIDKYLIDGMNPGSGQEYSLKRLNDLILSRTQEFKFFLAGGITPDNVLDKIIEVNPFGIDVSSGVEYVDNHGLKRKSYEKIKTLINNANR